MKDINSKMGFITIDNPNTWTATKLRQTIDYIYDMNDGTYKILLANEDNPWLVRKTGDHTYTYLGEIL